MFERTTVVVVLRPGQFVVNLDGTAFVEPTVYGVWVEETLVPDEILDRPSPFDPVSSPFGAWPALMGR
ncbi:hypothetical protein IPP92_04845 [Candidatus Saccharibacteria bacterium]|jgi:hypothetical protein|uniref:hypothetical protein n=1 Tax=Candidatus Saccharimonas aalborgensis TaxID=1332188 RepID=UPI00059DE58C|nr:hypothetical protein [Candidatus Saccharimonas aalborgensis]QQS68304.1 MAG: hypothetical protein IPP24_04840 [Candidatus Saccharibacteria bacterium]QQS70628.1 MAG: hypothetical protein IPP92_04845 [Candidatus Saccharibacteria bacterium]